MRGYAAIGLYNPKFDTNVGSALRAAHCFGSAMIAVSGFRYRCPPTDVSRAFRHLPLLKVKDLRSAIPHDCVPVAVDLIASAKTQSLTDYIHPERAFYIFGPEDGTLGYHIVNWCRDIVYIPTRFCLNLAASVNVVLYDRMRKRNESLFPEKFRFQNSA